MRIETRTIAEIKACQGLYSVGDTARHFNVSKATVHGVWTGKHHVTVMPVPEPPNVETSRIDRAILIEDARTLLARGMSVGNAAKTLGIGRSTLYSLLREEGVTPCLYY